MAAVAIVVVLALIEYTWFGFLVGRARGRAGIAAPAITGDPIFERYMRVQQNTLEQLVVFVPAMFLFGYYVNAWVAALIGLVFIAGRALYLRLYVADPARRGPGVLISMLAQVVLLLGGGIGAAVEILRGG